MFSHLSSAIICALLALAQPASSYPVVISADHGSSNMLAKRLPWDGGFIGTTASSPFAFSGFFPFAFNSVNAFNRDAFNLNFSENTLFQNNKHADVATDNINAFNNVNVIG